MPPPSRERFAPSSATASCGEEWKRRNEENNKKVEPKEELGGIRIAFYTRCPQNDATVPTSSIAVLDER